MPTNDPAGASKCKQRRPIKIPFLIETDTTVLIRLLFTRSGCGIDAVNTNSNQVLNDTNQISPSI